MNAFEKIIFHEKEYFLIGNKDEGGAIATKEQYEGGRVSFAHLYPNGEIKRFLNVIGNVHEVQFTGEFTVLENPRGIDFLKDMIFQNAVNDMFDTILSPNDPFLNSPILPTDLIGQEIDIVLNHPDHQNDEHTNFRDLLMPGDLGDIDE